MSSWAGLLDEGSPACPICSGDSCTGHPPTVSAFSIESFYARPADMAQQEPEVEVECDALDDEDDGDDARAKHGPAEDRMKRLSEDRSA